MATETKLREFGHLICSLYQGKTMTKEEAKNAYKELILNEQPELQQGAFLAAHLMREPTVEELSGAWHALDEYDTAKIDVAFKGPVCDIVGTGSDAMKTVNCSTPAAFIAAAAGLPIAKKGARLVTGVSGATDIFQLFGFDINSPLEKAAATMKEVGICYLPGETFLKSGWSRLIKSMRFTSAFNIIGPLTMPCEQTNRIVIGAYSELLSEQLIAVIKEIGFTGAVSPYGMVNGIDKIKGIDEFSNVGPTNVCELKNGEIKKYTLHPEDFGIKTADFSSIASKQNAKENADSILKVLKEEYDTPLADFFVMNAAAALYISGFAQDYKKGTEIAREAIASGKAYQKLQDFLNFQ
jgi:anthranilate phosphoribosyltransferase